MSNQFFNLWHIPQFDGATSASSTRARHYDPAHEPVSHSLHLFFALVVPSLLVPLLNLQTVQRVVDVSPIPRGIPMPMLPDLTVLSPDLILSALAIAVVIAIQGAGVSQSVSNPDGSPINPSRDMVAQGVGNMLSGVLAGIPAGGSVGQTALNVSVGAQSRWSGVFGGIWM